MYIKTLRENVQSTENAYKHAYVLSARVLYSMKHKPIAYILHFFPFFSYKRLKQPVLFFFKRFSLRLSTVEQISFDSFKKP